MGDRVHWASPLKFEEVMGGQRRKDGKTTLPSTVDGLKMLCRGNCSPFGWSLIDMPLPKSFAECQVLFVVYDKYG